MAKKSCKLKVKVEVKEKKNLLSVEILDLGFFVRESERREKKILCVGIGTWGKCLGRRFRRNHVRASCCETWIKKLKFEKLKKFSKLFWNFEVQEEKNLYWVRTH